MGAQGLFGEAVDRIGGEPISARMARKAPIRHLDPTLLLATLVASAFGAVMIFSATASKQEAEGLDPAFFLKRQVIYMIVGAVGLLIVSFFDYRYLRGLTPVVYGGAVLLLVLVITPLGSEQNGAQSWFDFGTFQMQPSEFAKLATIVALAAFLGERKGEVGALEVAVACALTGVPSLLILFQPDLGSMLVYLAILLGVLLVAGGKIRHFLSLALLGVVAVFIVLQAGLLEQYQIDRITSFMNPNPNVTEEGYNQLQSKTAIANGGFRGKGLRERNTQTSLDFVPEQQTDFIFTAVGEQLGFVGSAALLALFAVLLWRAIRIAAMSRDLFGTLIAAGIAVMWMFQIFINIGMTMGIMPITGLPLPFISFGGSSLITNFVAVGMLLNIHMRRYL